MVFPPRHIACAIDFSRHTDTVLRWGTLLAASFDARLTLFHAIGTARDQYPGTVIFERSGQLDALTDDLRRRMDTAMAPFGGVFQGTVVPGDPVETLVDFSRQAQVDLVVAASHGLSGLQRALLGTVVERLARRLDRPLLVVRALPKGQTLQPGLKTVAVCCDPPYDRDEVLGLAGRWARHFNAQLYLLHALESPLASDELDDETGSYGSRQAHLLARTHRRLEQFIPADEFGLETIYTELVLGSAPEMLPDQLRRLQADLAVVGVRTRRKLKNILIGSTTEAILRYSSGAVLTLPLVQTSEGASFSAL